MSAAEKETKDTVDQVNQDVEQKDEKGKAVEEGAGEKVVPKKSGSSG